MKLCAIFNDDISHRFNILHYSIYSNTNTIKDLFPKIYIINYPLNHTIYDCKQINTILPFDIKNPQKSIDKFNQLLLLK
jgi:hypothetical protein